MADVILPPQCRTSFVPLAFLDRQQKVSMAPVLPNRSEEPDSRSWYHLQGDPGGVYLLHQGKLVLVLGLGRIITAITRL